MSKIVSRLEGTAGRLGNWWVVLGPGGVLFTLYGVITPFFHPIAQYGWAAIVLAAIGLALATLLAISLSLVAWRVFRPIQPAPPSNKEKAEQSSPLDAGISLAVEKRFNAIETNLGIAPSQAAPALDAGLIRRVEVIEAGLESIFERQADHVSTPDLAQRIERTNSVLEAFKLSQNSASAAITERFGHAERMIAGVNNDLIEKVNALLKTIPIEVDGALEPFRELGEKIEEQIQGLSGQLRNVDLDLAHLLFFAVDSVTVQFLDRIIHELPLQHTKNITQYDDPKKRDHDCLLLEKYVSNVLGWVGRDTDRGMSAAQVVRNAENEMQGILLNSSEHDRPPDIQPYVFQRLAIADLKCRNLVTFLEMERDQVAGRIGAQRSDLILRMQQREKARNDKAS